jgi:tripartite-type tricarboxylate transporter receptor subunit TctC
MKERMAREGFEPVAGSSEALQNLLKREVDKWRTVVKKGNIRIDTRGL